MHSSKLVDSGVHGALMALDETFDLPVLSHILQIMEDDPAFNTLNKRFEHLVAEYRNEGSGGYLRANEGDVGQQNRTAEKSQKNMGK